MENFGKFAFGILMMFIISILNGYVFMTFWDWFVITAFAVNSISLIQAIGISYFISFVTVKKTKSKEESTWGKTLENMIYSIIFNLVILGLGYLIHLFY